MTHPFLGFLLAAALFSAPVFAQTYTTNFPTTENPISEGGKWTNGGAVGIDFQDVQTANGRAFSSDIVHGYDDCIACLTGFPPDQSAQATIYRDPAYSAPSTHEVELHLRTTITAKSIRTYEMDFWFGGSTLQIVRWNGQVGDFTILNFTGPGLSSLVTGDIVKAQIVGSTITVYKNNSLIATCTDNALTTGNPGMGFFVRPGGTLNKFCITSFTAAAVGGSGVESKDSAPQTGLVMMPSLPNPFSSNTAIRYSLGEAADVRISLFDPLGRFVRHLMEKPMPEGYHSILWDGKDGQGLKLPGGVYLARIEAGKRFALQKLLLIQ